jgi:type I restriction enzyme S subunit
MRLVRLADLVRALESGARPKGGVSTDSGEIPSLGGEHLDGRGGFQLSNTKRIPEAFFKRLGSGRIEKDDILIVKDGATTGKISFVGTDFPFCKAAVNEHVFRLAVVNEEAAPRYVFHFLASPAGQAEILSDYRGATVGGIGRTKPAWKRI